MNKTLSQYFPKVGPAVFFVIITLTAFSIIQTVFATNISSTLTVGNANPSVTAVTVDNATSTIILTANATKTVTVNFQISDNNGCSDVFSSGSLAILLYRSSITSSSCNGSQSNLNCYKVTTSTNNCSGSPSANATATFHVYYFADPTDASSSYDAQSWLATVIATDSSAGSGYSDSAAIDVTTLVAVNVTTSSISYGTVTAGSDTGATNQTATTTNAGNVTTTLQLAALATLTSGSNIIATSSQRYSTSSFTYFGTSTPLTSAATTVSGVNLVQPTSTTNVERATFWGVSVSSSYPTGTYTGTTIFSALFVP